VFIRSKRVTAQPDNNDDFENTFAVLKDETIYETYECQEGLSRCCGLKTTIALTNSRLIIRQQQPDGCFDSTKGAHIDTAIFLSDIELMRENKPETCGYCMTLPFASGECCGDKPKTIEIKGGFGTEYLTFKMSEATNAAAAISSMILPFKENKSGR
jgi:hypothetical protein